MEYGLVASKSFELVADFFWQLRAAWNAAPLWAIIAIGLAVIAGVRLFFRTR